MMLTYPFGDHFRDVYVSENVGLGIHVAKCLNYFFAAAHADEPVMNNCDLHRNIRVSEGTVRPKQQ